MKKHEDIKIKPRQHGAWGPEPGKYGGMKNLFFACPYCGV